MKELKHKIICGECIEVMQDIETASMDMILCDLPYGITARNKWDTIISFDKLWYQYERIIKNNGAIILTASQPFASQLVCSNLKLFKYEWIWEKSRPVNFLNAKKQPLRKHESVLIFYKKENIYNPRELVYKPRINKRTTTGTNCNESGKTNYSEYTNYPVSVLKFDSETRTEHPTQKPIALFEYLIRTYTNENDTVLDNCVGSGTTLIAAEKLGRNSIGIDISKEYCEKSYQRLLREVSQIKMDRETSVIERIGF